MTMRANKKEEKLGFSGLLDVDPNKELDVKVFEARSQGLQQGEGRCVALYRDE